MRLSKYNRIIIQIVLAFSVAIIGSYVPEIFRDYTGDWYCKGNLNWKSYDECNYLGVAIHDQRWHWGLRHWLWMVMSICIFIVQFFSVIKILNSDEN